LTGAPRVAVAPADVHEPGRSIHPRPVMTRGHVQHSAVWLIAYRNLPSATAECGLPAIAVSATLPGASRKHGFRGRDVLEKQFSTSPGWIR
jgi:hypothetical protein